MRSLPLDLLDRSHRVRAKSLLTLRSLRLRNSSHHQVIGIFGIYIASLWWKNKVVVDIHKSSDSFQKVGRGCPTHDQSSIMRCLLLLPATIQRVVHETCSSLWLLWLATLHLLVYRSCRIVFLTGRAICWRAVILVGGRLPTKLLWFRLSTSRLETGVLAQRPLNVLRVRIHIIQNLLLLLTKSHCVTVTNKLWDVVWALYELLIDRSIKIALIMNRWIVSLRMIKVFNFRCTLIWNIILK
jgi:hypothetical protein